MSALTDGWGFLVPIESLGEGALVAHIDQLRAQMVGKGPIASQTINLRISEVDRELAIRNARATKAMDERTRGDQQLEHLAMRIADIAREAFGPLPVQSADDNITAIEHGISEAHQRHECDRRDAVQAFKEGAERHADTLSHLSAAANALGEVMLEMQRRTLLARPRNSARTIELLEGKPVTDEQLGRRAAAAFEAAATELARCGHPGATATSCPEAEIDEAAP